MTRGLFEKIGALERKHASDQGRLQQLANLRRRIQEEIDTHGVPPAEEMIDRLLVMIDNDTLPSLERVRALVDKETDRVRARVTPLHETVSEEEFDLDFRPKDYSDTELGQPHRGSVTSAVAWRGEGAEYLPEYGTSEVEIARITLRSTTGDVVSVRARPTGARFSYSVVNEYEVDYAITPKSSAKPLTLRELITLIDTTSDGYSIGLVRGVWEMMVEDGSERGDIEGFLTVESGFYPQLGDWYRKEERVWLEGM